MNLPEIQRIAREQIADRASHPWKERGNKYDHGLRTAKLTLTLRRALFPDDASHDGALTVAAWFHDVCNRAGAEKEHGREGAALTRRLLEGLADEETLREICELVLLHDDRYEKAAGLSDWVKILQDADYLDHFGSYDVWMYILAARAMNETASGALRMMREERSAGREALRAGLNFELSRRLYDEKMDYFFSFCDRFETELDGRFPGFTA